MAKVTVYNRSGSVSGTIETDEYIFTQFPGDSGISTRTYSCDKDMFPYVKVYGNSGLKYYLNDGEEWTYTNANQSAKLMPRRNGFKVTEPSGAIVSNFNGDIFWATIEKDEETLPLYGSGEMSWASLGHYYVKDSKGLSRASYPVYAYGHTSPGGYRFKTPQYFGSTVFGRDISYFATGGYLKNSTDNYRYEVLYDDFGTNTDGQDISVKVEDNKITISTTINKTTSTKTYYKAPQQSVLIVERASASWEVQSPQWPNSFNNVGILSVSNVFPVYPEFKNTYSKAPPIILAGAKSGDAIASYKHVFYPGDYSSFPILGETISTPSLKYKTIHSGSQSFSNISSIGSSKDLEVDYNDLCVVLEQNEDFSENGKEYRLKLPSFTATSGLYNPLRNIYVGCECSEDYSFYGMIILPKFYVPVWSQELDLFVENPLETGSTYTMNVGSLEDTVVESKYTWAGIKEGAISKLKHISVLKRLGKISLWNGLLDFTGWRFSVYGPQGKNSDGEYESGVDTNYNTREGSYPNANGSSYTAFTHSSNELPLATWDSYTSFGYLNSSNNTKTYAHSVILVEDI